MWTVECALNLICKPLPHFLYDMKRILLQVLAEAAGQLPAGTSSGNIMPGLSNLGAGGARHIQHQVGCPHLLPPDQTVLQRSEPRCQTSILQPTNWFRSFLMAPLPPTRPQRPILPPTATLRELLLPPAAPPPCSQQPWAGFPSWSRMLCLQQPKQLCPRCQGEIGGEEGEGVQV